MTSNPSPAYVARVAGVFNNDGTGVRGNLSAVLRALLLDTEARSATDASQPGFGRLREPMLHFVAWARAYNANSPSGAWAIGNTSDPATALGQSPLRSATVFNFFRPGYVQANTAIAGAGLVAPEFQITNESSVVGYLNFMQRAVAGNLGDITPDNSSLLPLADDAPALLAEINLVLAANQLSPATVAAMAGAVQTMPGGSSDANWPGGLAMVRTVHGQRSDQATTNSITLCGAPVHTEALTRLGHGLKIADDRILDQSGLLKTNSPPLQYSKTRFSRERTIKFAMFIGPELPAPALR